MNKNVFSHRTERFFPAGLIFGGAIMIFIGTGILIFKSVIGFVILLAGIAIVFLHYGVLIDVEARKFKEYWGFPGLKFGKWKHLPGIEYISLTKSRFSQQIGLRAANTTMRGILYKGNLRVDGRERILVIQSTDKDKVMTQLKHLAKKLDVKLLDCTEPERIWVDL
ncbi:MAG: hypothetical protein MI921_23480 [Cytophagales bacterium]|nr:hypothetical protein [Cytophagales bacterium]